MKCCFYYALRRRYGLMAICCVPMSSDSCLVCKVFKSSRFVVCDPFLILLLLCQLTWIQIPDCLCVWCRKSLSTPVVSWKHWWMSSPTALLLGRAFRSLSFGRCSARCWRRRVRRSSATRRPSPGNTVYPPSPDSVGGVLEQGRGLNIQKDLS